MKDKSIISRKNANVGRAKKSWRRRWGSKFRRRNEKLKIRNHEEN